MINNNNNNDNSNGSDDGVAGDDDGGDGVMGVCVSRIETVEHDWSDRTKKKSNDIFLFPCLLFLAFYYSLMIIITITATTVEALARDNGCGGVMGVV